MTVAFTGEIEFPASRNRSKIVVRKFSSVETNESWKQLTDTADIVLPRNIRDFDKQKVNEIFQNGDPVIIRMGYDGDEFEEFSGYVFSVSTGIPVTIRCENEMYKLKRETVSISKAKCTLKELLTAIAPGYAIQCDDTAIGSVRYSKMLVSEIFDDLKSKMGLYTYFRRKKLICGRTSIDGGERVKVIIEKQANETLKERNVEKIYVRLESLQKNGKMLKGEKGEKKGSSIVIKQPNLTKIEIERIVNDTYTKATMHGLDGDLTLFGVPQIKHGMIVNLKSYLYPEKDGSYYIDAVKKTADPKSGYRQIAKLGSKTN